MAGDANNIRIWEQGDVFIFDPDVVYVGATHLPGDIDDDLHAAWLPAGLMLGDPGVEMPRDIEQTDVNSWQQGRVLTRYKNGKVDLNFTLLEDNEVTADLIDAANVPGPKKRRVALEFIDEDGYKERRLSVIAAHLWVANDDKKQDIDGRQVTASLRPQNGVIWTIQEGIPT